MTYVVTTPVLGVPPIAVTNVAVSTMFVGGRMPGVKLGMIVHAYDPTYGEGEFIFLLGVASTVIGSCVTWDGASTGTPTYQTALAPATAGLSQPVAFAMSANVAAQYGWYCIGGHCIAATNGTLATGPGAIYLAGSGQVTSTQVNGKAVVNARNETATGTPAANQAIIVINRPFAQGQAV